MRLVGRHRRARRATGSIQSVTVAAGETTTVNVDSAFRDFDGDPLTYAASTSNRGVAAASVSGSSVTISGVAPGSATVTVAATDPAGTSATQSFDVTVESRNRAPRATAALGSRTLAPGARHSINLAEHFRDPDGDPLTYAASTSSPAIAAASVIGNRLTISGVAPGGVTVTVAATDPAGTSATQSFDVTVESRNRAPRATAPLGSRTLAPGETYSINLAEHFRDPDGDPLTYTASTSSPDVATASVSRSRGTISGVAPGSATITVAATDPVGASAEQSFNVTVIDPALRRRRRSTTPRAAPTRRAGRTG